MSELADSIVEIIEFFKNVWRQREFIVVAIIAILSIIGWFTFFDSTNDLLDNGCLEDLENIKADCFEEYIKAYPPVAEIIELDESCNGQQSTKCLQSVGSFIQGQRN